MTPNASHPRGLGSPGVVEVRTPPSTTDEDNGTPAVKIEHVAADQWAAIVLEDRSRQRTVTVTLDDGESAGHQIAEVAPSRAYLKALASVLIEEMGRRR